jgi:peptide/nickel transport system permease protein
MATSSKPSLLRDLFWRRLSRNRMAMAGGAIVLGMFVLAVLAPLVARDPGAIDIARRLQAPNWAFPLGTDDLGRDVLARIFYGARISLLVGFVAVGISTLIGIALGALAGYYGRWVDGVIMRFVDIMLCFPSFFLILAVIAFLEPSIWNIMIIIGLRVFRQSFCSRHWASVQQYASNQ